jgi:nucleotide-binding universal stress UspA family protein
VIKGEIKLQFFKVYYEEQTNQGYIKTSIKYFSKLEDAQPYANELLKELKDSAEQSDDPNKVIIENEEGEIIEQWIIEDGKVVKY